MTTDTTEWENFFVGAGPDGILLNGFKTEALKPLTGKLRVISTPDGAEIYINGGRRGFLLKVPTSVLLKLLDAKLAAADVPHAVVSLPWTAHAFDFVNWAGGHRPEATATTPGCSSSPRATATARSRSRV